MCGRKSVPISRYAASETTRSRARAPAPALPWATNHSTARPWADRDRGGARGRSAPRRKPKRLTATGTASAAMKNETTSASAMVSASGRKNAPTTPDSAANGRRITIVDRLEPTSAGASSRMPRSASSPRSPPVWCRSMFSTTTIASSAISPTPAATPASVIRLIVCPVTPSSSRTMATVNGMDSTAIRVSRGRLRNTSSTSAARPTPMRIASRVPRTESETNCAWS